MRSLIVIVALLASIAVAKDMNSGSAMSSKGSMETGSSMAESSVNPESHSKKHASFTSSTGGVTPAPKAESSGDHPTDAPNKVHGCTVNLMNGDVASLFDYAPSKPTIVTVDADTKFRVSPCSSATLGSACSAKGYVAMFTKDTCGDVYSENSELMYEASSQTFTTSYKTTGAAPKTLTLVVACNMSYDGTTGFYANDILTIPTFKACAEKKPANVELKADSCSADFTRWNRTFAASLSGFASAAKTIDGAAVDISPCSMKSFKNAPGLTGCPDTQGFMAIAPTADTCVVLTERVAIYDPITLSFTTTLTKGADASASNGLLKDASTERQIVVVCGPDNEAGTKSADGVTITFTSSSVCAEEETAPAPSDDDDSLSTGAVVGIVIGALAIIVIILVVLRWKSSKSEEEGEYQRV